MGARPPASSDPIFGTPRELPRGPHGLTRDEVSASQRLRLMAAISDAVADRGYAAATIGDISRRAGVSPRTFYEHFADKQECFLAAYETFIAAVVERIGAELDAHHTWPQAVAAGLRAYLTTLDENRQPARAFLVELDGAGAAVRRRRREACERFAASLADRYGQMRRDDPALGPLSGVAWTALLRGTCAVAADALEAEPPRPLVELAGDLGRWVAHSH